VRYLSAARGRALAPVRLLSESTMHTTQTTLTGDDRDDEPADTATTEQASSSSAKANLAPPEQRGGDGCCPWCLASAETFEHHGDDCARCGYCDASIPLGTDWYERGEKIVL
jgi:hypothetical protein